MLFDALGKDRTGLDLPTDFADRRQRFEAMSTWEPARLKETARKASEEAVAAIGDAAREAPETIVNVPFGKVPIPVVRGLRLNEYIIHGHDLTPAIGRSIPIPDWFIDRALGDSINLMSRLHQRSPHKGKAASFHIHRTDGEGEWILRAADGQALTQQAQQSHSRETAATIFDGSKADRLAVRRDDNGQPTHSTISRVRRDHRLDTDHGRGSITGHQRRDANGGSSVAG